MKIGLLLCDHIRSELQAEHKCYPDMFLALFCSVDEDIKIDSFAVVDEQFPDTLSGYDAWIVSGSRYSVLDNTPWMKQLTKLLLKLYEQKQKIIGICFGHQIIAQALGGDVINSPKGWGIGIAATTINKQRSWLKHDKCQFNLIISHKDQVSRLPKEAETIASSDFCEHYMLQYGNQILTIQGHPEFSKAYIRALMLTLKAQYPAVTYEHAQASLAKTCDDILMAQWIINFILEE